MSKACVYRHFDRHGRLLYVGMTKNALTRLTHHSCTTDWYDDIVTITITHYLTRKDAALAEAFAIENESPLHTSVTKPRRRKKHLDDARGRPIAMTPERIETAKAMLADGKPVKDILPALKALDGPPISRSKVFQWVADFRALEPNEPTDDR